MNYSCIRYLVVPIALVFTVISGCQTSRPAEQEDSQSEQVSGDRPGSPDQPERIIVMIGDGMGVPAITAGSYANGEPLSMLSMNQLGFMTTHSYEYVTTDSAASATALASGDKTHFQGVSVKPGTTEKQETKQSFKLHTLAQQAEKQGWKTGLVATSRIVHATPAAFGSHVAQRHSYEDIAEDLTQSGIDLLYGAGSQYFENREDDRNLLKALQQKGYRVTESAEATRKASAESDKVAAFLHDKDMPAMTDKASRKMSLSEMTDAAIGNLHRTSPNGFFLMVEGSQIDWQEHNMSGHGTVAETTDFDRAVQRALKYTRSHEDTLLVVTADHGTGGLAITSPDVAGAYTKALGGDKKAQNKLYPSDSEAKDPYDLEATESFGIGTGKPTNEKLIESDYSFGPKRVEDKRFTTAFGYFSLASYAHREPGDSFYSSHTPDLIPIFSEGRRAEYVAAAKDNAQLGKRLHDVLKGTPLRPKADVSSNEAPENIVFVLSEGLGLPAVTAGEYAEGPLRLRQFSTRGLTSLHSTDSLIADDAASATALVTGHRTSNQTLSMAPSQEGKASVSTLLERAERADKSTGLITTHSLEHVVPGSLFSHVSNCESSTGCKTEGGSVISEQFVALSDRLAEGDGLDVTVSVGSDSIFTDGQTEKLEQAGTTVTTDWNPGQLKKADRTVQFTTEDKPLDRITEATLNRLSSDDEGFALVLNTDRLVGPQHRLETDYSLMERMLRFDNLIETVSDFARRDGETLVVVASPENYMTSIQDTHYAFSKDMCGIASRCGGPKKIQSYPLTERKLLNGDGFDDAELQGEYASPEIFVQYAWITQAVGEPVESQSPKAATFAPVWAMGPGASEFEGFQAQYIVGQKLKSFVGSSSN